MGISEIVIILVIALILFGPEDLPVIARKIGKVYFEIRKITNELTKEFQSTIDSPVNTFNKAFEQTTSSRVVEKVTPVTLEKSEIEKKRIENEDEIRSPESAVKVDDPCELYAEN